MMPKLSFLIMIVLPLWWLQAMPVENRTDDPASSRVVEADEKEEKPFVLLATVHNYGYVEPCG
ncbi:MAG: hypothetical protein GWP41_06055 [Planctomycetia bacterium]|jgi:hypothetical protein|nr:hypothetical protein [Planctomycetia bacterium]NCF98787.1 hypothetical protein [Planctomycetia bacterium]NCG13678.1 hypothetical protein [Planctomycetia bacterium]NCG56388.1 hypothetical protein [Pseudomonadota bacterium]